MSMRGELFVSLRNFRTYRKGTLTFRGLRGAVLTIALSMLPVLVVLEVSSGMIEGITRRYVELGSFHLQSGTYGSYREEQTEELLSQLEEIPGVTSVTPFLQGNALVYSPQGRMGIQIRGLSAEYYRDDPGFSEYLEILSGGFEFGDDSRGLVLSRPIAQELGVEVGAPVKLLVSRISPSTGRTIFRPGNYHVSGIFTTGYHELDMFTVYMDRERAETVFGLDGTLSFGFKTGDFSRPLGHIKDEIKRVLPKSWYTVTWRELDRSLYENLESTKTMLLFIMGIIIVVAAVNISSSMLNLVMEKQEEISVLKTLGLTPRQIRRNFLFSGFLIGFLGIAVGMLLGLCISVNINELIALLEGLLNFFMRLFRQGEFSLLNPEYYLETIPIRIPLPETLAIAGFTMITCLLASFLPARRASKILPLEVMRRH